MQIKKHYSLNGKVNIALPQLSQEKLCVHADFMGYVIIKVVLFHAFHSHFFQSVVDFGILWHAYWHSSTWENHQNSQIQTLIPTMTRARFKHRATLIMMVPVHFHI